MDIDEVTDTYNALLRIKAEITQLETSLKVAKDCRGDLIIKLSEELDQSLSDVADLLDLSKTRVFQLKKDRKFELMKAEKFYVDPISGKLISQTEFDQLMADYTKSVRDS